MGEIIKRSEIVPFFFYGLVWQRNLRQQSFPGIDKSKALVRRIFPNSQLFRYLQQTFFTPGAKAFRMQLYHEPSYLPFAFNGPTIITIHDLSHMRYPDTHPRSRVRMMDKMLPKAVVSAARILTDSKFTRQEIISVFGIHPSKVHTVHLGVSRNYRPLTPLQTEFCLQKYQLSHGFYILAVGTLEPRKNLLQLFRAYQKLPDTIKQKYPLVVAGMKGWLIEGIESELRSLELKGQIRLLGYVPEDLLPLLYAGAAMLVYPSLYEGFGLPPLEAMACGTPVITSNRSSLPEVVGNAALMIHPEDVLGLAESILKLIEDPAEHAKKSRLGIERARLFTWEKCASQTLEVYKKVLWG